MSTWRRVALVAMVAVIVAPAAKAKIYVRWAGNELPPARVLGVRDVVIPWSDAAQSLMAAAKKEGYSVYLEATLAQMPAVAAAGANSGAAGIVLKATTSAEETQLAESAKGMRAKYPKLKFLVVGASGKQPDMRGWLVFQKNGILQVSSPTSQPWLDQNLATVRYERAFETRQPPFYTFSWDVSDPLVKQNGPSPQDYSLAVAEAGAFHADLLLDVYEKQQKGLASGDKEALADWEPVKRTIAFYERKGEGEKEAADVAVLTDDYDISYEAINLMARHNIPFRVLHSANVTPADLLGLDLMPLDVAIEFATPTKELVETLRAFAERGGVVVVVNQPGTYPWEAADAGKTNGPSVTYTVGKGRVIELKEPVSDPETFAQDVRRLMAKQYVPVSLWNSLTTLVVEYPGVKAGERIVELVNYDEESTQVQVQVKGNFGAAKYESPERGCCETLKTEHVNGFTEFVVPDLVSGGRVHLEAEPGTPRDETKTRVGE
jgi:hypothetical protein